MTFPKQRGHKEAGEDAPQPQSNLVTWILDYTIIASSWKKIFFLLTEVNMVVVRVDPSAKTVSMMSTLLVTKRANTFIEGLYMDGNPIPQNQDFLLSLCHH